MAPAASYRAYRLSAWTRRIVTFGPPAYGLLTNAPRESNAGRRGGVPEREPASLKTRVAEAHRPVLKISAEALAALFITVQDGSPLEGGIPVVSVLEEASGAKVVDE
jgi:hypothetical protein